MCQSFCSPTYSVPQPAVLTAIPSHAMLCVVCCVLTTTALSCSLSASTGPRFRRLNASVASLLDEYSLVSFVPLDISDEDSIGDVLLQVGTGDPLGGGGGKAFGLAVGLAPSCWCGCWAVRLRVWSLPQTPVS